MSCEKCARKTKAFCATHDRIHLGFIDGTTACQQCVGELVEKNKSRAKQIETRLLELLHKEEFEKIGDAVGMSSVITGDPLEISILRFVACKALRVGHTLDTVLADVALTHSTRPILGY